MAASARYATRVAIEKRWTNPPKEIADHPDVKDWRLVACLFDLSGGVKAAFSMEEESRLLTHKGFPEDLSMDSRALLNFQGWRESADRKFWLTGQEFLDVVGESDKLANELLAIRALVKEAMRPYHGLLHDVRLIAYHQVVSVD